MESSPLSAGRHRFRVVIFGYAGGDDGYDGIIPNMASGVEIGVDYAGMKRDGG